MVYDIDIWSKLLIKKMWKSVVQLLYRQQSSSVSENVINTFKCVNSYRITLSNLKNRYVPVCLSIHNLIGIDFNFVHNI